MNRNSFLKACVAAGTVLLAPLAGLARLTRSRINKGVKVDAGKDRFDKPIDIFEGDTFYTKVSTKDTDGDWYIFESTREKKGGPLLHYHYEQDEWWYILEGEFLIKVGEQTYTAKAGDSVFGPRMVPHTFAKVSDGPARLLMAFQPAGKMEEHFQAVSEGKYARLSEAEKNDVRKQHGFEVVGPALTVKKAM